MLLGNLTTFIDALLRIVFSMIHRITKEINYNEIVSNNLMYVLITIVNKIY